MDWLNFRHLYSFWMVWKCGGFRKASDRMRVAQSAISDQVSQLEDYLGKKLLIRSHRKIELTGSGKLLLNYADNIFFNAQEINQIIRDEASNMLPASINIGIVGGISRNFVSRFISSVQKKYPETNCNVLTGSAADLLKKLESHDLHIVFSIELPSKKELETVLFKKIFCSEVCVAGNVGIIEEIKAKRIPAEVPFYEFVFSYPEEVEAVLQKYLCFQPKVCARSDDIPLLRFLANSTDGIVLIPVVGVMDDTEKEQIDTIIIPELGTVDICAYSARKGPYRNIAEKVLAAYANESPDLY
ncbi:MAG: LysR family transcriptional regulator [Oligoflexales bacterium]